MGFLKEFKAFALKGNVMDMAVGVIIGGAFGKIVTSLVNDIIMPPIGVLMGGTDFTNLSVVIKKGVEATETTPAVAEVVWRYGAFIQQVVDFLILALCVFMMIKAMNHIMNLRKKEEEAAAAAAAPAPAPEPSNEEKLLSEIRDLLKEKK
jgi:large conductance mechanosensitive channel